MLPTGMKFEEKVGKSFEPLPEDVYQVELLDIELQEKPSYNDKSVMEKVLSFQFVVLDQDERELRGRSIWRNFVPTFLYISSKHGKNALYQITEAIIKKELTEEQKATFGSDYINKLIGYQCRVTVKNKEGKEGKVFSNIETFLPVKTKLPALTEEEKEKARVKKEITTVQPTKPAEDDEESIPTIVLDDETNVTDIPF